MPFPSFQMRSMEQSGIRQLMALALETPDAIRLEVGEPRFTTPAHIIDASCQAARDGWTGYSQDVGLKSLRETIAEVATTTHECETFPDEVCVTMGAIGALFGGIRAVVDPDDEVLIPDPGWPNYTMVVETAGGRAVRYPLREERDYLPDVAEIEALIGGRTRALVVNSPSNPLGTVFPADLMADIVTMARERDLWLISDEVYHRILFDEAHSSAWRFHSGGRLIVAGSFSKTYAMTGWRVGYALAPPPVIELYAKIQEATVSNAPTFLQKGAEAALTGSQECVAEMLASYRRNRAAAMEVLDARGVRYLPPRGAFYVWVDIGRDDAHAFALDLLSKRKVAVAPGDTFGPRGRGHVRVSLAATEEDVREGLTRLADHLEETASDA